MRGHHLGIVAHGINFPNWVFPLFRASRWVQRTIETLYGQTTPNSAFADTALNDITYNIKNSPDLKIQIVSSLDSVCEVCPLRKDSCSTVSEFDEDDFCLGVYNLDAGKTYSAKEIIEKIARFTQRTGLASARTLYSFPDKTEHPLVIEMMTKRVIKQLLKEAKAKN